MKRVMDTKKIIQKIFSFSSWERKISLKLLKNAGMTVAAVLLLVLFYISFEIYAPVNPDSHETVAFTVEKGWGDEDVAAKLKTLGIIRSEYFFKFYTIVSLRHGTLQAGDYSVSPKMSIHQIVSAMSAGDTIKNKLVILEGWTEQDVAEYLEAKGLCQKDYFLVLSKKDYSDAFDFLKDKPKNLDLEGYLFPDTYEITENATCEDALDAMLSNFEKKLTPDLRAEIAKQGKSIFDIVTVASLIEKEVRTVDDKIIVSGILSKRLAIGMPLQLDSTINYITGKSDPAARFKDIAIDSPYNTYKYYGLPLGPISNPGADSIRAAIYPKQTDYLYYLSDGKTYFSRTLEEHNAAKAKYLR